MHPTLGGLVIYTKAMDAMIAFYVDHFGYELADDPDDRIKELRPPSGGMALFLHPAAKSQKQGQALVKLAFAVPDVAAAREVLLARGVQVGPVHGADGYAFANLKDPSGNPVSLTSRAFRPESGPA